MKTMLLAFMLISAAVMMCAAGDVLAQEEDANYDESKIPAYTLPDPLLTLGGTVVATSEQWVNVRRPEVLKLFTEQVYGRAPGRTESVSAKVVEEGEVLGGKATRRQVALTLVNKGQTLTINILMYIPKTGDGKAPAFLGLNFQGNHSISSDPAIILNTNWMRPQENGLVIDSRSTEKTRGVASSRWPVEMIVDSGYALVTAYYGDIDPDYEDGFENGVHALFETPDQRTPESWGSIAGWAWGLRRIMDYLETDNAVDKDRVALLGHSRLGKTSLWAGAQDPRFKLVISNNSGCGGAALSRRKIGETVEIINTSFPHWFCDNFKKYNDNESELPLDQHMLIALVAPRPAYVASAVEDRWADPKGEFLSLKGASPVYMLMTGESLTDDFPAVDEPITGIQSYHIRSGGHDVKDFDWQQYIKVANIYMTKK